MHKSVFLPALLLLVFGCIGSGPAGIAFSQGLYNEPKTASCTGLGKLSYVKHSFDGSNFRVTLKNGTASLIPAGKYSAEISGKQMNSGNADWKENELKEFSLTDSSLKGFVNVEFLYAGTSGIRHSEMAVCKIG